MKLKLGTILTIQDPKDKEKEYKSKVVDLAIGHLMIDYPVDRVTGRTTFFVDGTELSIIFTDELKNSYRFFTEVQGRHLSKIPMLKISYPGDEHLTKIQRREFVRVEVNVDVAIENEDEFYHLVTEDLSAGGLAIALPEKHAIKENTKITVLFVLPFVQRDIEYVRATARVIRIFEKSEQKVASLEFVDIAHDDRQHVIQYCFERELHLKRKLQ